MRKKKHKYIISQKCNNSSDTKIANILRNYIDLHDGAEKHARAGNIDGVLDLSGLKRVLL